MRNKSILIFFLIASIGLGLYALTNLFSSIKTFKSSFNEFDSFSESEYEIDTGEYNLFEIITKHNFKNQENVNYLVSIKGESPKVIEIRLDTITDSNAITYKSFTYTISDSFLSEKKKRFRSIGQFNIDKKQSVKIISKVNDIRVDKFAYKLKNYTKFAKIINLIGLFLGSVIVFFVSVIIYLIKRDRAVIREVSS